jgi:putative FmdB family regulatory protein
MPFYEYQCKSCGHDLEAMQKFSDPPLKKCPQCGKSQLQRLMSAPVFRLKGGGWYETDFKGDKDNQRNLADRPEADAPKDQPKDGAADGAKAGEGKDGKVDAQSKDAASKDAASKDAAPKDKPADKPAEKASEPAKKTAPGKSSVRRVVGHGKSAAKRPIKRPVHKAKRRV